MKLIPKEGHQSSNPCPCICRHHLQVPLEHPVKMFRCSPKPLENRGASKVSFLETCEKPAGWRPETQGVRTGESSTFLVYWCGFVQTFMDFHGFPRFIGWIAWCSCWPHAESKQQICKDSHQVFCLRKSLFFDFYVTEDIFMIFHEFSWFCSIFDMFLLLTCDDSSFFPTALRFLSISRAKLLDPLG